jgi:hypothetical protein
MVVGGGGMGTQGNGRAAGAPGSHPSVWEQFVDALHSNQNFEYLFWIQVRRWARGREGEPLLLQIAEKSVLLDCCYAMLDVADAVLS